MKNMVQDVFLKIIGIFVAIVSIFPLVWMAIAGFKKESEVLAYPFKFFPSEWIFTNYMGLFETSEFIRSIGITLMGAVIFTFLIILINSMAAYVFARIDFPLKKFLVDVCHYDTFYPIYGNSNSIIYRSC